MTKEDEEINQILDKDFPFLSTSLRSLVFLRVKELKKNELEQ